MAGRCSGEGTWYSQTHVAARKTIVWPRYSGLATKIFSLQKSNTSMSTTKFDNISPAW